MSTQVTGFIRDTVESALESVSSLAKSQPQSGTWSFEADLRQQLKKFYTGHSRTL